MHMVGKGEAGHVQQRPKRHVAGGEREGPNLGSAVSFKKCNPQTFGVAGE